MRFWLSSSSSSLSLLLYFNARNINYKAGADWLSLRSMSPYLCNHRLRKGNTQRGEKARILSFSLLPPSPEKLAPATQDMIGPTLEPGGEGPGPREGHDRATIGSFVLQWFFWFKDAQEQAPVQVPNHDKFFDAQTMLWPSLTLRLDG